MIPLQEKGVSAGVAGGPLYFYRRAEGQIAKEIREDIEAEKQRMTQAQQVAIEQLSALAEKTREDAGDEAAFLFETHMMFVEDEDFAGCIFDTIETEKCNAEYAVSVAGKQFSEMFAAMDDEYMQARSADILDVARRLVNNLSGYVEGGIDSDVPVVLAADDLAPSETVQLDKTKLLGFETQGGSGTSHTAILARTMGIPAICGLGDVLSDEYEGKICYIDGETGEVIIEPDDKTRSDLLEKQRKQNEQKALLETMKGLEDVTLDGKHIKLYCNIGSPDDVEAVLANDGQGVGLFRSEFIYLQETDYPSEEVLFEAYKAADAAHKNGIWIGICGELGADPELLPTFLEMGINELSVSPTSVLPLRAAIRKSYANPKAEV